ncbi:MAG: MFS transporter [Microthrixaceae bacterium]|nr:MFS transporter [Microthrixaceae bacterium]MCB1010202.1 MFS transporter [Microthrixaceae bacterium]MCB9387178.1 MFS transporter [Microthrixaceae bacterium]MCO5321715.1 MFS transporter [Microthrixaceae bacterium]
MSASAVSHTVPKLNERQKRTILISMSTALIAVVASVSGLNVAQREIAETLGASAGDVLWIINAYTLSLAALLMPVGAIGDRWGRRPVLLTGLAVFALASLAAAFAPSVGAMIAARALAGAGAAMVMPVTLSVITTSFPAEERSRAIGIWAGFAGAGGIIGLWMAAIMVDVFAWQWLFTLPIVMVGISGVLAWVAVPNSRELSGRFDTIGSILSACAIGGLVFGIHEGPEKGWSHLLTVMPIVIGLVALVGFIVWELRSDHPLLDVTAFANRGLASGTLTITLLFAVMFGIFLVLFPFLQTVLGWSAIRSAFAMMPMALMMMPMSANAPKVAARIGRRPTMLTGLGIAIVGLSMLALMASVEGGYMSILPGLLLLGVGVGLTMTPSTEAITATLPDEKQGVASALNDTSRELGGAVGVALLGSILTAGYSSKIGGFVATLPAQLGIVGEDYFLALGAAQQLGATDPGLAQQITAAAQNAYVESWSSTMWVGVAVLAVAFAYVALAGPRSERAQASEPELVAA